jgi:type IV pilus assembly protein PilB
VPLEQLLLRHGAIDEEQLRLAREDQKTLGGDLGRILVDKGYISDELLCRAQSHQLGIPRASPETMTIAPELLQLVPVQLCETLGIIPVGRGQRSNAMKVATSDPGSEKHLRAIASAVGESVEPVAATAQSIDRAIRRHYYGEPVKAKESGAQGEEKLFEAVPQQAVSHPQFAALVARVERLEQTAERERRIVQAVRVIGDILVEKGLVTREDYFSRARGK